MNIIKKNKMTVIKGSSINADTIEIRVENENEVLFEKKYSYGYDISYKESFATDKKPFDVYLIQNKAKEYNIDVKDIQYAEGSNLFKETMEKEKEEEVDKGILCPNCGSWKYIHVTAELPMGWGFQSQSLEIPYMKCVECGYEERAEEFE